MKNSIKMCAVLAVISLTAPVFAQTAQQQALVNLAKGLAQGARGDQVKILQAILAADSSIYPEGVISGTFGPLTKKAVVRFQKAHGVPQVGVVGPQTLKKLNEELKKNPIALESSNASSSSAAPKEGRLCAIVPQGHLIASGWLKKQGGVLPVVPACQTISPDILKQLEIASTTLPASSAPTSPSPLTPQPALQPSAGQVSKTVNVTVAGNDSTGSPTTITVNKGDTVQITFHVQTEGTYYGGLDFRSSVIDTGTIIPGSSKTVTFTATNSFAFTPYWPATNVSKPYTIQVVVQ